MKRRLHLTAVATLGLATLSFACDRSTQNTAAVQLASNPTVKAAAAAPATAEKDIVQTAVEAGSFSTLVGLLQDAELVSTLQGDGPFTVFAPTDAAFAKVPAAALEELRQDKKKLASVLTYHVIAGSAVTAADVVKLDGQSAKTVNGQAVAIAVKDGTVRVDEATVIATDIPCTNGVIHVIDRVMLPR